MFVCNILLYNKILNCKIKFLRRIKKRLSIMADLFHKRDFFQLTFEGLIEILNGVDKLVVVSIL